MMRLVAGSIPIDIEGALLLVGVFEVAVGPVLPRTASEQGSEPTAPRLRSKLDSES